MVGRFLFKDRDGRTPLPEEFRKDLIPKNVLTSGDLDELEEENIVDGLVWLHDFNSNHRDWLFWNKLHKKLFHKVWKWAGNFRLHELNNEDFNHPASISQNIKKLEGDLTYWLDHNTFADQREAMARFHEQLLTIHPYTNGNGRWSRILTEYICKRENIKNPTWGKSLKTNTKKHREAYVLAVTKARRSKNYKELIKFMWS